MRLPAPLYGGNPESLLQFLRLEGRRVKDELWDVRSACHDWISWRAIADQSGRAHRFDLLDKHVEAPVADLSEFVAQARKLQNQLWQRAKIPDETAAIFHSIQIDLMLGQHGHLGDLVESAYEAIGNRMPIEGTETPAFPDRSVHLITISDELIHRTRLPGILFRFDQDPDALETVRAIQQAQTDQPEGYFASSSDWYHNLIGVAHYLGPLLGCLTPRFWGFHTIRTQAIVLFSLGRDLRGFGSAPMELMQLLPASDMRTRESPLTVELERTSCTDGVDWWVMRLNQMSEYLSDPTTFADANGMYSPHEHHHWLLTIDQVFGLMTSLQSAHRDFAAQRALMNNLLDIFADRIFERDLVDLCSLQWARERAAEVRGKMSKEVAALLMPAADRAVDALEHVQDGFFIQRQRGDTEVRLRMPDGRWESRSPAKAAALLLKLYRNATHGFGRRKGRGAKAKTELDTSLLIHHDGQMPADIVLLPYLYLLDTLCNPDRVRSTIMRKVATG
ncbi:hypothetical protein MB901379_00013 [Mycobacterium basiliense]|uniref:Uncharacterized protein n=2 Tax=Mycobacterium basiliense TaxID=2094119 RepID=A0A447G7Q1_9MYCO|nr:hypothetical protein MB901379_00013 [Mycobacterium basiliense]